MDKIIIGFDRSGEPAVVTEASLLDDAYLSQVVYLVLDYQGEQLTWLDGRYHLRRVIFLNGLRRNLAVYQVIRNETDENA